MSTFHPFPRLPFEIRTQIWQFTVEPRTVDARVKHRRMRTTSDVPSRRPLYVPRLVSSTPVPAPLQACREARNLGLYQKIWTHFPVLSYERRYLWANLDVDIISIGTTLFELYKPVATAVKRLRFERENTDEGFYHFEARELRNFVNVEEVYVDCADGLDAWCEATVEHYFPCGRENVFLIDPENGQMVRALEFDRMCYEEQQEAVRLEDLQESKSGRHVSEPEANPCGLPGGQ